MKFVPAGLGLVLFCAGVAAAAERSSDQFQIDSNVVLINATVLDGHNRPVRGLTREQFRLYDEKAEQRIAYFSEEEVPLSLAVIFDISGSMDHKMAGMRAAVDAVLQDAGAQDEFSLITFADRPQVAVGWSPDPGDVQNRLLLESAHGETSLLDALATGLSYMKKARNIRRAMLIFSDGGDNHSRFTERHLMLSLAEAGVQIYAVDSAEQLVLRTRSPEEIAGPDLLERLCDLAGGRYFRVDGRRELDAAAGQISRELRSQYLIGYVPSGPSLDGRFHHVRVEVKRSRGTPKISVFWRRGYRGQP
ncbi:MAG TPA: VWA domain-containing protein [Bryobacteraceae bacterium]|jgi:Ca-activated chloride channel family protein|nr:VWA domain-containing protein [Bryobacteraceae bacterium]